MVLLGQLGALQRTAFSQKYLLATNMTIAFVLGLLGDILEQHFEHLTGKAADGTELKYDFVRTRNMGLSGCVVDIICHYWYQFLEKYMPEDSLTAVIKKIILDQLICTPIYIAAFFIVIGILQDETADEIWWELNTKALHLYLAECMIWPIAQFINFYWLPCRYRVLYDNIFALGFDIYTSRVKHWDRIEASAKSDNVLKGAVTGLINKLNQSALNN